VRTISVLPTVGVRVHGGRGSDDGPTTTGTGTTGSSAGEVVAVVPGRW
jgi:hypothetical protein